ADSAQKHHPVFAPWHALAALPSGEFAGRAPIVIGELALRPVDDPQQRVNWPIVRRLLETMPASMEGVAQVYGQVLAETDAKWRTALAASTQPAGSKPITALPDPADEELRQVLYAEGSPTALTMDEAPPLFDNASRQRWQALLDQLDNF